jgi:hypothetical protein
VSKQPICEVTPRDDKHWYLNGKLHRVDGPAIEYTGGAKYWYLNGKRHRVDGPACECANGTKEWWLNGKYHRVDGPAVEWANGTKEWWLNDIRHRADGPAVEWADGNKQWWLNGNICKPIEVFKAATHEQKIHMLCFYASEFMPWQAAICMLL